MDRPTLTSQQASPEAKALWSALQDVMRNEEAWWILDDALKSIKEAAADEEMRMGDMHRDLNRRAAKALGKPFEGEGSSWHDIPECIERLVKDRDEMQELHQKHCSNPTCVRGGH